MHPVTPVLRGWKVFAGVLLVVGYQASDNLSSAARVLAGRAGCSSWVGWRWWRSSASCTRRSPGG